MRYVLRKGDSETSHGRRRGEIWAKQSHMGEYVPNMAEKWAKQSQTEPPTQYHHHQDHHRHHTRRRHHHRNRRRAVRLLRVPWYVKLKKQQKRSEMDLLGLVRETNGGTATCGTLHTTAREGPRGSGTLLVPGDGAPHTEGTGKRRGRGVGEKNRKASIFDQI